MGLNAFTVLDIFNAGYSFFAGYCFLECKGGAVVRALAFDQCGLGSNLGVDAICFIPNNSVKFNTVDIIRAEKYFSQLVRADKLSRLDIYGVVE